jgi:hypothetical protein
MKVKKALKRLHRVETILTTVIEQYVGRKHNLRDLLDTAKGNVLRATETLSRLPGAIRKPPANANQLRRRKGSTAKRKGTSNATGRPLRKTA